MESAINFQSMVSVYAHKGSLADQLQSAAMRIGVQAHHLNRLSHQLLVDANNETQSEAQVSLGLLLVAAAHYCSAMGWDLDLLAEDAANLLHSEFPDRASALSIDLYEGVPQ